VNKGSSPKIQCPNLFQAGEGTSSGPPSPTPMNRGLPNQHCKNPRNNSKNL